MSKRYPPEVREKAVCLAVERLDEYESPYAAAKAIGPMVDMRYETLRVWIEKALSEGPSPLHSHDRDCRRPSVRSCCGCGRKSGISSSQRDPGAGIGFVAWELDPRHH